MQEKPHYYFYKCLMRLPDDIIYMKKTVFNSLSLCKISGVRLSDGNNFLKKDDTESYTS